MDNAGRLFFGVRAQNNQLRTVISPSAYNNNQWHMVTATMSSAGMRLYVDGNLVGSRADTTAGEAYLGYWRVGGDVLSGWPNAPSTRNFAGRVDEVAVYPTALVAGHHPGAVRPPQRWRRWRQPAAGGVLHLGRHRTRRVVQRVRVQRPGRVRDRLLVELRRRRHRQRGHPEPHVCRGRHLHRAAHRHGQPGRDRQHDASGHRQRRDARGHRERPVQPHRRRRLGPGRHRWHLDARPPPRATSRSSGGAGTMRLAASSGPSAYLTATSARDVDLRTTSRLRQAERPVAGSMPPWSCGGWGPPTTGSRCGSPRPTPRHTSLAPSVGSRRSCTTVPAARGRGDGRAPRCRSGCRRSGAAPPR